MAGDKMSDGDGREQNVFSAPAISLPAGGGAIRGIGEKFAANPVTGAGSMTVPVFISPGRSGFSPHLSLAYNSGAGNGPFGFGWSLSLPAITRKTDKGLPEYQDETESDTFMLSGIEDLVPVFIKQGNDWLPEEIPEKTIGSATYRIKRYRPRIEGMFARIERWVNTRTRATHWRSLSRDNVVTVYGRTAGSQIRDPAAPDDSPRIFSWLICESYDDKGNAIYYEYEPENSAGINSLQTNERNRTDSSRSANRYIKRIKYCNQTPVTPDSLLPREFREDLSARTNWLFEVVFDYEEGHYEELPADTEGHRFVRSSITPNHAWECRRDSFSGYRSGFEVRTYRLCHRVLIFHHFPAELGTEDYLVRSTAFKYKASPVASFLTEITQAGFKRRGDGSYLKKALPPLELEYSEAVIQDKIQEMDEETLESLPFGVDGTHYQWMDLDGEGLSGILIEQGKAWFYKHNISALPVTGGEGKPQITVRFTPAELLTTIPSFIGSSTGSRRLLDLAGDGQLDVVNLESPVPGFFERTREQSWQTFRPFESSPNLNWQDPSLQFADLTGDGLADILITGDEAFSWYRSLAEAGFAPARQVRKLLDEEQGPQLLFADKTQSIHLADFSGDGLSDLVRIRNGEVCYWPNLGYGRFGARVTMDNSPHFTLPGEFNPRRVLLADIDGSGVTDIIYLGAERVSIYLNEAGNSWAGVKNLQSFPVINNLSAAVIVDLPGNGTACLVWSSALPADRRKPLRYLDLMGGVKPHLLVKTVNNLGAETRIHYAPSTRFYLADKAAGKPWITRIHFPVHVVERVENFDYISRNRFLVRYAYHHGYFDGSEREFRGFGMVEQFDTGELAALSNTEEFPAGDNVEAASHVPPVLTRTWFHTGAYIGHDHISDFFAGLTDQEPGEYYREPGLSSEQARQLLLPDTILPTGLSADEEREACRALKGSLLRQEVYALDGTDKAPHPYTVRETNYTIRFLQPRRTNRHAVFFTYPRETITWHYERHPDDPRIMHTLVPEVDDFGNTLKEVAVGYGRRRANPDLSVPDQEKQRQTHITCTANRFTNAVTTAAGDYRAPLPCESSIYELTGYTPTGSGGRFRIADFVQPDPADPDAKKQVFVFDGEVDYADLPPGGRQRRLIEQLRTFYRPADLGVSVNNPLQLQPFGTIDFLALPGETYRLAFTPELLSRVYQRPREGRPPENLLPDPPAVLPADPAGGTSPDRGGYVDLDGNGHWWIPSGRVFYSTAGSDTTAQELAYARRHFFRPCRYRNPFGQTDIVTYDTYDLLILETHNALGNRVTAGERDAADRITVQGNDYRVLQPVLVSDFNRNRSAVAFDAFGLVAGTAVAGKPGENRGDTLDGFEADLDDRIILEHLADPLNNPHAILGRATARMIYDLTAYYRTKDQPDPQCAVVYTLARETHYADLEPGQQSRIRHTFSYSDGYGREIQKKLQAEPGPVPLRAPEGNILTGTDGLPRMSEDAHNARWVGSGWVVFNNKGKPVRRYEPFFTDSHHFEFDIRIGVSPVFFYDPAGRMVAVLHPDHSWEKVVFDAWQRESWDVNDTVLAADPGDDAVAGSFFRRLTDTQYLPTWYAQRRDGSLGPWEQEAAVKAAGLAGTQDVVHFDSLGRIYLTVAHNQFKYSNTPSGEPPASEFYHTRVVLDIKGNRRELRDAIEQNGDALGRVVLQCDYNMLGNCIRQNSMDAGERWMLQDVTGKSIRTWDSRTHQFRTSYDPLRRPVASFMSSSTAADMLTGRTVYGESQPDPETNNLRGHVVQLFDQAGVVTSDNYDFKGNLLRSRRQLALEYRTTLDWSAGVILETETFVSRTCYDALNRPVQLIAPHREESGTNINIVQPVYNEANLPEQVNGWLNQIAEPSGLLEPATADLAAVTHINYNARGQRELIDYGNGVRTTCSYDPHTFRLVHLLTRRNASSFPGDCPEPPPDDWPGCQVQNLHYFYDPAGNITRIRDEAQQTVYFRNRRVDADSGYLYDALYRLIEATGREHLGQAWGAPPLHAPNDRMQTGLLHPGDGNVMGRYLERFLYDAVGNILQTQHRGSDPVHPGWTRHYTYAEASLLEPAKQSNRLSETTAGSGIPQPEHYVYDAHGNMTRLPHLGNVSPVSNLHWDYLDQVRKAELGGGGNVYYVYDSSGQRIRKVWEKAPGLREERIYLGSFELFRRRNGTGGVLLERETLHLASAAPTGGDGQPRIVLVETRTIDTTGTDPAPPQLIRYQFNNHLGSASLELDARARVISYEEYSPYGSTTYQAVRSRTETPRRYRYTGKERDEETGLYYYGARYLAVWLGRWISADPAGDADGSNLYQYVRSRPVSLTDPEGKQHHPHRFSLGEYELTVDPDLVPHTPGPPDLELPEPGLTGSPAEEPATGDSRLSLDPPVTREIYRWIEERIQYRRRLMEERAEDYRRRGWRLTEADQQVDTERIRLLETLREGLERELPPPISPELAERSFPAAMRQRREADDLLTLANVVYNEAGTSNDAAKVGVAYAYLNRTGGVVREPVGEEVSDYSEIETRWQGMTDTERLSFLQNFIPSLRAARERLADTDPAAHDPTGGATHWVSPAGLRVYNPAVHGTDRYRRTVGSARDRAFPLWARDPSSAEAHAMQHAGQLGPDYAEVTIRGVIREQFLFYRDVR